MQACTTPQALVSEEPIRDSETATSGAVTVLVYVGHKDKLQSSQEHSPLLSHVWLSLSRKTQC